MSWEYKTLGEVGTVARGKSKHRPRNDESLYGGAYPFVQTGDVKHSGLYLTDYSQTYNEKGLAQSKLWPEDTLCITIAANIADTAILGMPACFPDSILGFIPDEEKSDVRFVKYCFDLLQINIQKMSQGSTQDNLSLDKLDKIQFSFPQIAEQKKIAAVLSALDEKIALNKKMNQKLEAMAKRLYDYWFVQFDFPDENGRPYKTSGGPMVYNETLNREIPEGWDVKKICDLSVFEKESTRPSSNPNVLYKHFSIPGFDECGSYVFEKGCDILSDKFIVTDSSILVSKLNPWTSRVVWGENLEDSICSTEFVVMKLNSLCEKGFLYMLVKQPSFIDYCTRGSSGTSHSHRRVNPEFMMNFMFAYNESVVRKFSAIASQYAQMIVKNLRENRRLSALRDKLLPLLMNGQVMVG